MNLCLRPAANEDRAAIEALVSDVLTEYGLAFDPEATDADLRDIHGVYHLSGGFFDVLVDEAGQVVGCVGLLAVSRSTGELRKMYLAPAARGRGWGRRLLERALAHAAARGFTRIVLETATVLRDAISLYESRGFRPYTPDHLAPHCNAAYFLDL